MSMTEAELEALLKREHWSISRSKTGNQTAFSARSGPAKQRITRYIATAAKLAGMTEAEVLAKLKKPGQSSQD